MIVPRDRVTLVGILNATPDSFSDGGRFADAEAAVVRGRELASQGAHVVDVGGESTRPGAREVPAEAEIGRTRPVVAALAAAGIPVSVDTRKAAVAEAALAAGAVAVNDVSGGRHDPKLLEVTAAAGAALILGHLRGEPAGMQDAVAFDDVLGEVTDELGASLECARCAGVVELVADPGIGFGKHAEHNLALLSGLGRLKQALGVPVLVGVSRKSFLGQLTGSPVEDRDLESHAAAAVAVFAGADAVRVHDVAGAARAVAVAGALRGAAGSPAP